MDRRTFIGSVAGGLVAVPLAGARAQEGGGAVSAPEQPRKREASEEIVVIGRLPRLPLPPSSVPASLASPCVSRHIARASAAVSAPSRGARGATTRWVKMAAFAAR